MKHIHTIALLLIDLLPLSSTQAQTMSRPDYKAAKARIKADYKVDKTACQSLAGNVKDICKEEAKAKQEVARAELEFHYTGTSADRNKMLHIKAETAYDVAKERCDDLSGPAKDLCIDEAKARKKKAVADVNLSAHIGDAQRDAAQEKASADHTLAQQKCAALTGDAKTQCTAAATLKFGPH